MGMLVMTASLLFIPIQLAAYKSEYFIMNHIILLMCSSWAYHSLCHEYKHLPQSIYFYLDKILCYTLSLHCVTMITNKLALYYEEKITNASCKVSYKVSCKVSCKDILTLYPPTSYLEKGYSFLSFIPTMTNMDAYCIPIPMISDNRELWRTMGISGIFILSSTALVVLYVEGVLKNKNYHLRGWKHWKYHIPHMMMHTSASICLCMAILL